MRRFSDDGQFEDRAEALLRDAIEADLHARMVDEIYVDADLLDAGTCPPDRRFFLADKEAWVYEHGNICELVFVRSSQHL